MATIQKYGVLRKDTYLHLANGLSIKIKKGTKVYPAYDPQIAMTFIIFEGTAFKAYRYDKNGVEQYHLLWEGKSYEIVLPNGPPPPYPLSILH